MTILITGSSGKTARRLAALLKPSHEILIASRSGANVDGIPAVKFDWTDPATYSSPYSHPQVGPIKAVYLVTQPGTMDPFSTMKPFIDTAKAHGVERFVLLSTTREDETTPGTGKVHAYLKGLGVQWAVLRPTWFMGRSLANPLLISRPDSPHRAPQRTSPSSSTCQPSGTSQRSIRPPAMARSLSSRPRTLRPWRTAR